MLLFSSSLSLLPAAPVGLLQPSRTPLAASNVVMLEPVERGQTGYKRYAAKQFVSKTFTPEKVAAEEQARSEAALDAALDMVGASLRSAVAPIMQADAGASDIEEVLRENRQLKQQLEESSSMRMRVTFPLAVVGAAGAAAGTTAAGIVVAPRILSAIGVGSGEVDEVAALEEARLKLVDPRAEASMAKYFPGSLSSLATEVLTSKVLVKRGYTKDNCLFATSTCPDEVNSKPGELIDLLKNRWGENFGLGGLGGVPFTGKAGFGAYSHHVPNGGKMFILFAPHVGVEYEGTVGSLRRVNQDGVSSACGAAVGAFKALKAEMAAAESSDNMNYEARTGVSDYFDAQINFIKAKLKQRLANCASDAARPRALDAPADYSSRPRPLLAKPAPLTRQRPLRAAAAAPPLLTHPLTPRENSQTPRRPTRSRTSRTKCMRSCASSSSTRCCRRPASGTTPRS